MEGGSLKEASSNYSFTEPHLAYIAQQVPSYFLLFQNRPLIKIDTHCPQILAR